MFSSMKSTSFGAATATPSADTAGIESESMNDRGVDHHLSGNVSKAMECYEYVVLMWLESPSAETRSRDQLRQPLHSKIDFPMVQLETSAVDSSLIGMGWFSTPLRASAYQDDKCTAIALFNISLIEMAQAHFVVSKDLLELVLMDLDNENEGSTPTLPHLRLMILTNLGMAHYRLGRYEDAAAHFEEASSMSGLLMQEAERRAEGSPFACLNDASVHEVKTVLTYLAYSLINSSRARDAAGQGRSNEALAMVREACGLCKTVTLCFGNDDGSNKNENDHNKSEKTPLSWGATYVEATIRQRRGELVIAEDLYRRCYLDSTSSAAAGDAAPLLAAAALDGVGTALFERRLLSSSIGPLRSAWSLRSAVLGENHLETIDALYALGRALHDMEEMVDALAIYERTYHLQRRVLGPGNIDTLKTLCNIARIHRTCGRGWEALVTCDEAVRAGQESLGEGSESHPYVLDMLAMRGMVLHEMGRREEASIAFANLTWLSDHVGSFKVEDLLAKCLDGPCLVERTPGAAAA